LAFWDQNVLDDGEEIGAPAAEGGGVVLAETGEGIAGFFEVGPPFESLAIF